MSGMIEMNQAAIDALVAEAYARGLAFARDEMAFELGRAREGWDNRAKEAEKLRERIADLELDNKAVKRWADECHAALEPAQAKIKHLTDTVNELRQALLHHVKETY